MVGRSPLLFRWASGPIFCVAAASWYTLACDASRFYQDAVCADGRSPAPWELLANGIDDDCDGQIDEGESAAHCGAANAPCSLANGSVDVECRAGVCVQIPLPAGRAAPETACHNGLDDDGNGVRDDGPHCEALIANARSPACRGAAVDDPDCPPTLFWMGSRNPELPSDETPEHAVLLDYDYVVDRTEVSLDAFARFLGELAPERCATRTAAYCDLVSNLTPETGRLPARGVNWCEAAAYCQWAGKRLPTEVEWERMAKGTAHLEVFPVYPWSDRSPDVINRCGNYNPECKYGPHTSDCCPELCAVDEPGGAAMAGDVRIDHVGGNVWEWVHDWFARYPEQPETGRNPVREEKDPDEPFHLVRGGAFDRSVGSARVTNRNAVPPEIGEATFGFRCARPFPDASQGPQLSLRPTLDACDVAIAEVTPIAGRFYLAKDWCMPELRAAPSIPPALELVLRDANCGIGVAFETHGDTRYVILGYVRADPESGQLGWGGGVSRARAPLEGSCATEPACTASGFQREPELRFPIFEGGLVTGFGFYLPYEVVSLAPVDALACSGFRGREPVAAAPEGGALLRVTAQTRRAELDASRYSRDDSVQTYLCQNLPYAQCDARTPESPWGEGKGLCCVQPVDGDERVCEGACQTWNVTLDLMLEPADERALRE